MSVSLSFSAQSYLKETGINPQVILDIEGVDLIFGAQPILKSLTWDDDSPEALWDNDLSWDGKIQDVNSRDYIQLGSTTTNITQQIEPDKGSISSISTVNIALIDKDGEVSKALSFDSITEILGRKAVFSIGFAQGTYPEDANPVFRGIIVDFYTEPGLVVVSMASPETLKRQTLLEKIQTELTAPITNSETLIPVMMTTGIVQSGDALKTYIRIDDEIMEVIAINPTSLGVVRGQLNTVASSHDNEASVETFYRLQGKPLELALKVMLSKENNQLFTSLDKPKSINFISPTEYLSNALIFDYYSIEEKTGLVIGDIVELTSGSNAGTYTIKEFGLLESGSYIVVNETLIDESEYIGDFLYKSKWNVLPFGLGMLTNEVDVEQFESIDSFFGNNFVDYDLYIKDTIDNAKDFIDSQIFFPQGLYSIPRKARSSVKFIAPPFTSEIIPTIDLDGILNITKIKQRRSVHKYLYNTFVYRYNVDSIEDKYLAGRIVISSDSLDRLQVGKKQMKVESDGLRNNAETTLLIDNVGQRMVDRYQYAPTYLSDIEVNYKTGYAIEVGDIVPFGGKDLQFTNFQTGLKGTDVSLFEVINKSLNVKNGTIKIDLVSTNFDVFARYAVVSLASNIGSGSTNQRIRIELTNDTLEWARESDKWLPYIGQIVTVRSTDYTQEEEAVLTGIDPTDKNFLLLEAPLSFIPASGYVIEPSEYQNASPAINEIFKVQFAHFGGLPAITSVATNQEFDVDDPSTLAEGSMVVIHSKDFTRDSFGGKYKIDSIVGSTITLSTSLDFTPQIGDFVNNSNFQDNGYPYILI